MLWRDRDRVKEADRLTRSLWAAEILSHVLRGLGSSTQLASGLW